MSFRPTTLILLVAILTALASNASANKYGSTNKYVSCPATNPHNTAATCNYMSESCFYSQFTGAPNCPTGTRWQCRCAGQGLRYACSCRGNGKDTDVDTDTEDMDVDKSSASLTTMVSSLVYRVDLPAVPPTGTIERPAAAKIGSSDSSGSSGYSNNLPTVNRPQTFDRPTNVQQLRTGSPIPPPPPTLAPTGSPMEPLPPTLAPTFTKIHTTLPPTTQPTDIKTRAEQVQLFLSPIPALWFIVAIIVAFFLAFFLCFLCFYLFFAKGKNPARLSTGKSIDPDHGRAAAATESVRFGDGDTDDDEDEDSITANFEEREIGDNKGGGFETIDIV